MGDEFCHEYLPGNGCNLPLIPGNYFAKYKDYNSFIVVPITDLGWWSRVLPILGRGKLDALIWGTFDGKWIGWSWQFEIAF